MMFHFFFYMIMSLIRYNLFPHLGGSNPLTQSEIARQNRKKRMELNRLKKNRSKSVQIQTHPDPNTLIDEETQLNIDSKLVEPNEKHGMFHSPHKFIIIDI